MGITRSVIPAGCGQAARLSKAAVGWPVWYSFDSLLHGQSTAAVTRGAIHRALVGAGLFLRRQLFFRGIDDTFWSDAGAVLDINNVTVFGEPINDRSGETIVL